MVEYLKDSKVINKFKVRIMFTYVLANFNVIKFQDDCGEIKFGILKTLKSVNFD